MKKFNVKFFEFDKYTRQPINGGRAFVWRTATESKTYILYNNGMCRIDNHIKFTSEYFEGKRKCLRWWRRFEKEWLRDYHKNNERRSQQKNKAFKLFCKICDKWTD